MMLWLVILAVESCAHFSENECDAQDKSFKKLQISLKIKICHELSEFQNNSVLLKMDSY